MVFSPAPRPFKGTASVSKSKSTVGLKILSEKTSGASRGLLWPPGTRDYPTEKKQLSIADKSL